MSQSFNVNVTKRERKRKLRSGEIVLHTRWVLNYRDPRSGKRHQNFFDRARDAQDRRNQIITEIGTGTFVENSKSITVASVVERWLANREGEVKARIIAGYREILKLIIGPLLLGTQGQRQRHTRKGTLPDDAQFDPLLGKVRLQDLSTAQIRAWHKLLSVQVGSRSANKAKMILAAAIALAAEDLNIRPPAMPTKLGRGRARIKKAILTTDQVAVLLQAAREDREKGVYVTFPFLAGTRPSEQLGLLWEDVDFEANVVRICRMQELDGSITNLTKTVAGHRDIPMCSLLRTMLLEWRLVCPRLNGELHRVFPGPGTRRAGALPRVGGGGPLLYGNFRRRIWAPALQRLELPPVTPHSARHSFISTLQAQGVEVGLVAKIAGHANATITLSHYTQAVRGAEGAVEALLRGYCS